jgi:hypothetical protein
MLLKTLSTMMLFASFILAAEQGSSDVFTSRSFLHPNLKVQIPFSQLFGSEHPKLLLPAVREVARQTEKCSIPLLEAKPLKTHDRMNKFLGPNTRSPSAIPPPIPACKGWN